MVVKVNQAQRISSRNTFREKKCFEGRLKSRLPARVGIAIISATGKVLAIPQVNRCGLRKDTKVHIRAPKNGATKQPGAPPTPPTKTRMSRTPPMLARYNPRPTWHRVCG